jgi:hypothetical protein
MTQCSQRRAGVKGSGRSVPAGWPERTSFSYGMGPTPTLVFDAQSVTSDAGLSAVRELDERMGLTAMAAHFVDDLRHPDLVVHPVVRLIREATYAYAAGYEDANDHPMLAGDAYFLSVIGPTNQTSVNPKRHDGLASEASLSRLLNGRALDFDRLGSVHVEWFARLVERDPPRTITLDIDGYDAETYGSQQLALFNGCYEEVMYYPLVVTIAEYGFVIGGLLRTGKAGSNTGAVELLRPILDALGRLLPNTGIRLRADSGFMDPELYLLLEEFRVQYAIRLRLNAVLNGYFDADLAAAGERLARRRPDEQWALYHRRTYKADSWPKRRPIVMKLQYDPDKRALERYVVVTNMRRSHRGVWSFYEHRGQCEQRNDELKNHLRAEKFSCCLFAANAVKLHLILMAHNLLAAVRIMLPKKHELKRATIDRLRVTLIKCGATVVPTARRLWIHASRTWPNRRHLHDVATRLAARRLIPTPLWKAG